MRITADPSTDPLDYVFAHEVRVRFAETDAMGIVHHASYLFYFEEARVAYLRAVDHDYVSLRESGLNFAVIEAAVKYVRPCHFDDVITVRLRLGARSKATFQIEYLLTVADQVRLLAVTAHACTDHDGRPLRLPSWLHEL